MSKQRIIKKRNAFDYLEEYPLASSFLILSILLLSFFNKILEVYLLLSFAIITIVIIKHFDDIVHKKTGTSFIGEITHVLKVSVSFFYKFSNDTTKRLLLLVLVSIKSFVNLEKTIYRYEKKLASILLSGLAVLNREGIKFYRLNKKLTIGLTMKMILLVKTELKVATKKLLDFTNSINNFLDYGGAFIRKFTLILIFTFITILIFIGTSSNEKSIVIAAVGGSCSYDTDCSVSAREYCMDTCDNTIDYDGETNKCTDDAGYGPICDPGYCNLANTCQVNCTQTGQSYLRDNLTGTLYNSKSYASFGDVNTCGDTSYEASCTATAFCDGESPSTTLTACTNYGQDYYADTCSASCSGGDDTSTCRSSAYAAGCTASSQCNSYAPNSCTGTSGYCIVCVFEAPDSSETACDCSETATGCEGDTCYNTSWYFESGSGSCCGDDANEYFNISNYDSSIDASITTTKACCNVEYDCTHNSNCYANNSFADVDVDSDADYDYCNAGTWIDCNNDSGCAANYNCVINDCIYEGIIINNIGQIGFDDTNQEYTALRTVVLLLGFDNTTAEYCRYKNSDGSYTNWEDCVDQKYWLLSSSQGLKQVFYQINRTDDSIGIFNDTIYLNYTGAGLDTTAPLPATIIDGDFTNIDDSLYIYWVNASDPESELLNIDLYYNYYIYVNGVFNRSGSTLLTYFNETGFNFQNNDNITVNVTVVNSAGLTTTTTSDGLVIDLLDPLPTTIRSSIPENIWNSTNTVSFNWSSSDNVSGIYAYSYILSIGGDEPDNVPEGNIGNLASEISKTYLNVADNIYYFKIKAKDNAGNWGNVTNYTLRIDATAPPRPTLLSELFNATNRSVVYTYTSVSDLSGIELYQINITDETDDNSTLYTTNSTSFKFNNTNHTNYYFKVRAKNGAGLWSIWSDEKITISDITRPGFWVKPQGNITSTTPIFVVMTNEISICQYKNASSSFTNFTYTNSTFHETKVTSNGGTYTISCTDRYGNVNTTTIIFNYTTGSVTTAPVVSVGKAFIGEIVNISVDTIEDYGELAKSRFIVYLNQNRVNDYSLFDLGRGNYTIALRAPKRAGIYIINISVDSVSTQTALDVENLTLTFGYTDSGFYPENTSQIVYNEEANYTVGLATDSDVVGRNVSSSSMQMKGYVKDNNIIFVTDKIDNINKRNTRLERQEFFDLYKPSFGYTIGNDNEIKIILSYSNYIINGSEELDMGKYSFLIKNIRPTISNKKTLLVTTDVSGTSDLGFYDYEG